MIPARGYMLPNEKRFSGGTATGAVILTVGSGAGRPVRCKRVLDSCRALLRRPMVLAGR